MVQEPLTTSQPEDVLGRRQSLIGDNEPQVDMEDMSENPIGESTEATNQGTANPVEEPLAGQAASTDQDRIEEDSIELTTPVRQQPRQPKRPGRKKARQDSDPASMDKHELPVDSRQRNMGGHSLHPRIIVSNKKARG